jgi:hypothetical protein
VKLEVGNARPTPELPHPLLKVSDRLTAIAAAENEDRITVPLLKVAEYFQAPETQAARGAQGRS